jgi:hypothetical protein
MELIEASCKGGPIANCRMIFAGNDAEIVLFDDTREVAVYMKGRCLDDGHYIYNFNPTISRMLMNKPGFDGVKAQLDSLSPSIEVKCGEDAPHHRNARVGS